MHKQNDHKMCIYTLRTIYPAHLTKNAQLPLKHKYAMAPFQLLRNRVANTHFRHTGFWPHQNSQRNIYN